MPHETVVIIRGFAFLCAFAAAFVWRHRLAQQRYEYTQREWKDLTCDYRDLHAKFFGAIGIASFMVVLVALVGNIYRRAPRIDWSARPIRRVATLWPPSVTTPCEALGHMPRFRMATRYSWSRRGDSDPDPIITSYCTGLCGAHG